MERRKSGLLNAFNDLVYMFCGRVLPRNTQLAPLVKAAVAGVQLGFRVLVQSHSCARCSIDMRDL